MRNCTPLAAPLARQQHFLYQPLARRGLRDSVQKCTDALLVITILDGIRDIVGLHEDLPIGAIDALERVMVRNEKCHPVNLRSIETRIGKESPHQGHAFLLLVLSVRIAVFLPAERARDVMRDGGNLEDELRAGVQPFQLSDGFRICPHTHEVVDVVDIPIGIHNHLLHQLRNLHVQPLLLIAFRRLKNDTDTYCMSASHRLQLPTGTCALKLSHMTIDAAIELAQFGGGTLLGHTAVLQHDNLVGGLDGTHAVCDDEHGLARQQT